MEIEILEVKKVSLLFVIFGEEFNFSNDFIDENGLFVNKNENVNGEFKRKIVIIEVIMMIFIVVIELKIVIKVEKGDK